MTTEIIVFLERNTFNVPFRKPAATGVDNVATQRMGQPPGNADVRREPRNLV